MYQNLSDAGVESVEANITPDMGAEARAGALLTAGVEATREAGLALPEETAAQEAPTPVNESEAELDYAM